MTDLVPSIDVARRRLLLAPLAAAPLTAAPLQALAQADYPSKPITFVVAYGAGGGADSRSRQITHQLTKLLGQPVVVDNKPGAGGNIGTEFLVRAKPDGYTIGMGNFAPLAVNKAMFAKLRYDPVTDLVPVMLVDKGPLVLMVNDKSPWRTLADVVAAARAKPGALTYASGGLGGTHHLSGELFSQAAKISMVHVPYKSGSAAATDLLAGQVDMMFEQMYAAKPALETGKVRAIAITSKERSAKFPAIPTFTELGLPQVVVMNWQGIVAPKGTPRAIIDKLNAAGNKILADREVRDNITSQSNEVGGGRLRKADPRRGGKMGCAGQIGGHQAGVTGMRRQRSVAGGAIQAPSRWT